MIRSFHVAFEGIDGSGKSSVLTSVATMLAANGYSVVTVDKTTNRPIRKLYRELISDPTTFPTETASLFLSLADYVWARDNCPTAPPAVYLWDRYAYSAFADAISLGISIDLIKHLAKCIKHVDLAIVFDVVPSVAASRKEAISEAEAGGPTYVAHFADRLSSFVAFQEGVRCAYPVLRGAGMMPISTVFKDSASLSVDQVASDCLSTITTALGEMKARVEC